MFASTWPWVSARWSRTSQEGVRRDRTERRAAACPSDREPGLDLLDDAAHAAVLETPLVVGSTQWVARAGPT